MSLLNERPPTTARMLSPYGVIVKGLPLPEKRKDAPRPRQGNGAVHAYPWRTMEVGDAFQADPAHNDNALRGAAWSIGCQMGRDYSTRQLDDGTTWVWRTK